MSLQFKIKGPRRIIWLTFWVWLILTAWQQFLVTVVSHSLKLEELLKLKRQICSCHYRNHPPNYVTVSDIEVIQSTNLKLSSVESPQNISKMTDIKDLGFSTADFAVFVTMLVVSFGIGIYHAVVSPNSKEGKMARFNSFFKRLDANINSWPFTVF